MKKHPLEHLENQKYVRLTLPLALSISVLLFVSQSVTTSLPAQSICLPNCHSLNQFSLFTLSSSSSALLPVSRVHSTLPLSSHCLSFSTFPALLTGAIIPQSLSLSLSQQEVAFWESHPCPSPMHSPSQTKSLGIQAEIGRELAIGSGW